jgi:hypothetical protein
LKKKKTKLNRGQILAAAVGGLNKELIANKAGYSRSSYYKHIENPNLGFHILIAYGKALKHDFTEELVDMPKYLLGDPNEEYSNPLTLDEATRQRDHWKDKYLDLLEKYNHMIEERMGRK